MKCSFTLELSTFYSSLNDGGKKITLKSELPFSSAALYNPLVQMNISPFKANATVSKAWHWISFHPHLGKDLHQVGVTGMF